MATSNELYTQSLLGWRQPAPKDFIAERREELRAPSNPYQRGSERWSSEAPPYKRSTEVDPNGKDPKAPGAKLDAGKVDVLRGAVLYFPEALRAVAHVSELGARKYSWMGWRSVPDGVNRYGAALLRHLMFEPFATDSGPGGLGDDVLHAAQAAWNSLARLELIIKERNERQQAAKNPST